ncbi:hypothetical protein V2W45_1390559 [Cenococcum geophilum]
MPIMCRLLFPRRRIGFLSRIIYTLVPVLILLRSLPRYWTSEGLFMLEARHPLERLHLRICYLIIIIGVRSLLFS